MNKTNGAQQRPIRVTMLGLRALFGAQGGIETHARDVSQGLLEAFPDGVQLEVIERQPYVDPNRQVPEWATKLALKAIWSPRSTGAEAIVHTLLGVLRAGLTRPDILHIHGIGPALLTPLARLLGLRVVVTHHGQDYAREKWGAFARMMLKTGERFAARFANERIVIAPGLDAQLLAMYGSQFHYVPNAAPAFTRGSQTHMLRALNIEAGAYVLHVGRIVPEKRQLDLIQALAQLPDARWKLVLAGGNDHPNAYEQLVRSAARADKRVVMAGVLPPADINQLLSHTGLFVLPSTHEGLPISLLEAMAVGAPVLVSHLPSLDALGLPAECYADAENVAQWANAMRERMAVATNPPQAVDWSPWMAAFSIDSVARQTFAIYERALAH